MWSVFVFNFTGYLNKLKDLDLPLTLTLAGTGRIDATPCGFSVISFLFTGRMSPFFLQLSAHLFYAPSENFKTLTPLKFDL